MLNFLGYFNNFVKVLQGSLVGGILQHRSHDKAYNIADRFFLGGPLTLRGFEIRGAGPHDQGEHLSPFC